MTKRKRPTRNGCKRCKKKRAGNYYEIEPMGAKIWLCDLCTVVKTEEIKIQAIIK